jgi:hypothetical protein
MDSDKYLADSFQAGLYPDISRSYIQARLKGHAWPAKYPHRENEDGSFDSICPICFRTVAYRVRELQLAELEREHICEEGYIPRSPFVVGRPG